MKRKVISMLLYPCNHGKSQMKSITLGLKFDSWDSVCKYMYLFMSVKNIIIFPLLPNNCFHFFLFF